MISKLTPSAAATLRLGAVNVVIGAGTLHTYICFDMLGMILRSNYTRSKLLFALNSRVPMATNGLQRKVPGFREVPTCQLSERLFGVLYMAKAAVGIGNAGCSSESVHTFNSAQNSLTCLLAWRAFTG